MWPAFRDLLGIDDVLHKLVAEFLARRRDRIVGDRRKERIASRFDEMAELGMSQNEEIVASDSAQHLFADFIGRHRDVAPGRRPVRRDRRRSR
jgi:hypothetical protein